MLLRALAITGMPLAVLLLPGAPARADADLEAVRESGLLGRWALDCSKPASLPNSYVEYKIEGTRVVRTMDGGTRTEMFPIRVVSVEPGLVRLVMELDDGSEIHVTHAVRPGESFQPIESVSYRNGVALATLIQDRRIVSAQIDAPVFRFCGD